MMTRKEMLMAMDDVTLNKTIKIAKTEHDRRRVLTDKQVSRAKHLVSIGVTCREAGKIFEVDPRTIRAYVDESYRMHINRQTKEWLRQNRQYCAYSSPKDYYSKLANYKRSLIAQDLITA